jgi:hypothetical protein
MSKRFFTNEGENTLLKKFAGVFASNPDIERFDALVGYLRASGYFALRPHLEKVPLIRIIVGIDVDDQLVLSDTDEEEVREMFLRLQNGTTLKAQERRTPCQAKCGPLSRNSPAIHSSAIVLSPIRASHLTSSLHK